MATPHGRPATGVRRDLREHPARFSLAQALRLLTLELEGQGVARADAARRVRITPWLSLAYPGSELAALRVEEPLADAGEEIPAPPPAEAACYLLENTRIGLYSTLGPLPTLYTEELLDEARAGSSVVKDFLDLVNNRIAHLFCRAEEYYDYARRLVEHGDTDIQQVLYSLMGQGHAELHPVRPPRPQAVELLFGARTANGLACYLASELNWPEIRVEECVARQALIPEEQRCRLGVANSRLGEDLVVGERIADCVGKIRIHLEELPEERLQDYLHGAPGHAELLAQARRYLDGALEFDLVLHPAA
ncbi:MAG: type VI secretion system baseplate subunit TssG, partial [Candidatus Accumulibacter sp.]|nr:type VI secretion system baseplate subunit TssG [Accumulibacter sp.]